MSTETKISSYFKDYGIKFPQVLDFDGYLIAEDGSASEYMYFSITCAQMDDFLDRLKQAEMIQFGPDFNRNTNETLFDYIKNKFRRNKIFFPNKNGQNDTIIKIQEGSSNIYFYCQRRKENNYSVYALIDYL